MKYKILVLLISLLIPLNIKAEEFFEYNCKTDKEEYTCEVYANYYEPINSIDFKIEFPSYISSGEFILVDNLYGSSENNWITIMFDNVTQGRFKLGTIKVNSPKKFDINDIKIKDLSVLDELFEDKIIELEYDNVNNKKSMVIYIIICVTIIIGIVVGILLLKRGVKSK